MGESETLAFAKQTGCLALTDDLAARELARSEGLRLTGTLGILSLSKRKGWIHRCRPLIEEMVARNRQLAPALVEQFLREEGEM